MTGEEFRANYHLQDVISEGSVISYRAQDISKAEVYVHFLVGKEPGDGAALVESLPNLDSSRARRVRLFVEVDAVPVLVTEPLEGFTTLKDWVGKGVEEAPASPPPGEYTMLFQVPPQVKPEVPPQVPTQVEPERPTKVQPEVPPKVEPEVPALVDQPVPPSPPADAGGLASKDPAPEAPETSAPGAYTQLFRVPKELGSEPTPAADTPSSPPPTVAPTQRPPTVAPTPAPEVAPPSPPTVASPPPASPPLPAPTPALPTGAPLGSPPPTVASEPPQPSWEEPEPPPRQTPPPSPPPPPVQESPPGKSEPGAYTQFFGKAGPGGHPGVQGQEEKHRGAAPRDTASGEDGPVWQRWRDTPGAAGEHIPSDNYLSRMGGEGGGYSAPDHPSSPARRAPPSPGGGWEAAPPVESGDGWRDSGRAQGGSPEPPTRPAAAPPKGSRGKGKKPSLALTILGVTLLVAVILVLVVVLTRMD